jgi:hypothetical protein
MRRAGAGGNLFSSVSAKLPGGLGMHREFAGFWRVFVAVPQQNLCRPYTSDAPI